MTIPHSHYRIDLEEIAARNETARHMIAGFAAEMPMLADFWRHLDTALTDNLTLCAEVARLNAELAAIRLDRANLVAAMRHTRSARRQRTRSAVLPARRARRPPDAIPAPRGGIMTSYRQ